MSEGITILGKFVTKEDIEHRLISLDERNKELECNNTMLREELEKIAANCLTALAGVVCTPAEGYIKAGTSWIASDIRALVKDYHQGSHDWQAVYDQNNATLLECPNCHGMSRINEVKQA